MERMPELRHVAVVVDGLDTEDRAAATAAAVDRAREIAAAAFAAEPSLSVVSLFSPQIRDWLLPPAARPEVTAAFASAIALLAESCRAAGSDLRLLGRTDRLAQPALPAGPAVAGGRTVAWFLDYSGRDEIVRAAARFLRVHPGQPLTEETLPAWLDTAGLPDPDLVLLAGGAVEPKDFLLWQASYAEYWHTPRPWLHFTSVELEQALGDYRRRHRRFGR